MNGNIKVWLRNIRADSTLCMLIPMEASIGYPLEISAGREYMLPFFFTDLKKRVCYPPFAYTVVSYPEGEILAYKNLAKNKLYDVDIHVPLIVNTDQVNCCDYYEYLSGRICGEPSVSGQNADSILKECIAEYCSGLVKYYDLLIAEKELYT